MSLSDQLRFLRARQGGSDFSGIDALFGKATVVQLHLIEQRQRDVSDDAIIEKLATYYHVPVEELQWHRRRSRKALSRHLLDAVQAERPVRLQLRNGETLAGRVLWWDLAAIGLQLPDESLLVVQRHAVIDWDGTASAP